MLTANPQLLLHLPPCGDDRILTSAHPPTGEHPPAVSIAVPDKQNRASMAQNAADAARAGAPNEPPASQQEQRQSIPRRSQAPSEAHVPIIAGGVALLDADLRVLHAESRQGAEASRSSLPRCSLALRPAERDAICPA